LRKLKKPHKKRVSSRELQASVAYCNPTSKIFTEKPKPEKRPKIGTRV